MGRSLIIAAVAAVCVCFTGQAALSENLPASSSLALSRFYSGPLGQTGTFPGKLVCLRCDLNPSPGTQAQCAKDGHRHALSIESDAMLHPLLAGTEEVLTTINSNALHDKRVKVTGKYYPSTGAIFVDSIVVAE